jgi:hypothetical protein
VLGGECTHKCLQALQFRNQNGVVQHWLLHARQPGAVALMRAEGAQVHMQWDVHCACRARVAARGVMGRGFPLCQGVRLYRPCCLGGAGADSLPTS